MDGAEWGRNHANAVLLEALQDAPTPQPPDSALTTYPKQWQDDYRKWYYTVRAEALKLAGVK